LTVITTVAVLAPSVVVAVTITVPTVTPVTTPVLGLTVAIVVLAEDHNTVGTVAYDGLTLAVSPTAEPTSTLAEPGEALTPLTGTAGTVTSTSALLAPSTVVTLTVAVPAVTPVITPVLLTLTIPGLLEAHLTALFVAFEGATTAVNAAVAWTCTTAGDGRSNTLVTRIGVTVTDELAVLPPSAVVAVMLTLPGTTPLTTPVVLTLATAESLEDHDTVFVVAFAGVTLAVNAVVTPTGILTEAGVRATPVTGIGVTVTDELAVLPLSALVAVILAVPGFTPATTPALLTVATAVLLEDHDTAGFVASAGVTLAVNEVVVPTGTLTDAGITATPVTAHPTTPAAETNRPCALPPLLTCTTTVFTPT